MAYGSGLNEWSHFAPKRIHTLCFTVLHWCRWEMMQCTLQLTCLAGPFSALAKRTKSLHTHSTMQHTAPVFAHSNHQRSTQYFHSIRITRSGVAFFSSFAFIYAINSNTHTASLQRSTQPPHKGRASETGTEVVAPCLLAVQFIFLVFFFFFLYCLLFALMGHFVLQHNDLNKRHTAARLYEWLSVVCNHVSVRVPSACWPWAMTKAMKMYFSG